MNKNTSEINFNPIKEKINGKEAERVIWTTEIINRALEGIQEGKPLKVSPFYNNNTKLLKPELVYQRTKEEIEDYIKCKQDPVYFASKCYLKNPKGGLSICEMRDYQIDYLNHLKNNRFSIMLSIRQSGKTLSFLSFINIKFDTQITKLNYYYIKDNIYYLPIFEVYNLYCKQTLIWKIKYRLYKIILKLCYGRKKRSKN